MTPSKARRCSYPRQPRHRTWPLPLRAARDGAMSRLRPRPRSRIRTQRHHLHRGGKFAPPAAKRAVLCDIRGRGAVVADNQQTVAEFGGIDICINNASAISRTNSQGTDMKRFD